MRVFAGPNGSGKSTISKGIQKFVKTGQYDIEKYFRDRGFVNLAGYDLKSNEKLKRLQVVKFEGVFLFGIILVFNFLYFV